ncbi:MAG: hypothetical protein IT210_26450 [Armatimonadetes bacterium]|nr:hypothetical protein [Armatimonadota bacterium]
MKRTPFFLFTGAILLLACLGAVLPTGTPRVAAAIYDDGIGSGTVGEVAACQVQYSPDGSNWQSVQNGTTLCQNDMVNYGSCMTQRLYSSTGAPTNLYATVAYPSTQPATYKAPTGTGYDWHSMRHITEITPDSANRSVAVWVITYLKGTVAVQRNGKYVTLKARAKVYPGELVRFNKSAVVRLHARDAADQEMDFGLIHTQNVIWGGDPPARKPRCSQFFNPYGQPR